LITTANRFSIRVHIAGRKIADLAKPFEWGPAHEAITDQSDIEFLHDVRCCDRQWKQSGSKIEALLGSVTQGRLSTTWLVFGQSETGERVAALTLTTERQPWSGDTLPPTMLSRFSHFQFDFQFYFGSQ